MTTAIWLPHWYGLDPCVAVGRADLYWFVIGRTSPLMFAVDGVQDSYPMRVRINLIRHAQLGELREIENRGLSYVFQRADGSAVEVDAEEHPGVVDRGDTVIEDWSVELDVCHEPEVCVDALAKVKRGERVQPSEFPLVVQALVHPHQAIRAAASVAIRTLQREIAIHLVAALKGSDEELRYEIIYRHARELGTDALAVLVDLARNGRGPVSFRAAQAAVALGCSEAELMSALASKSDAERAVFRQYLTQVARGPGPAAP